MPRDVRLKCDLPLLEKDAEDVFGDGGAADDPHEFALVINHRKLLELLLRQQRGDAGDALLGTGTHYLARREIHDAAILQVFDALLKALIVEVQHGRVAAREDGVSAMLRDGSHDIAVGDEPDHLVALIDYGHAAHLVFGEHAHHVGNRAILRAGERLFNHDARNGRPLELERDALGQNLGHRLCLLRFRCGFLGAHAEYGADKGNEADCRAHLVSDARAHGGGYLDARIDAGRRGDACHDRDDERRAQTAGDLAAGVRDGVAVGDHVIFQGIDTPCVHRHVRERLAGGLQHAEQRNHQDGRVYRRKREQEQGAGHEGQADDRDGTRTELVEHHAGDRADDDAHRRGGKHGHAGFEGRSAKRGLQQQRQQRVGDQACGVDERDDDGGHAELARLERAQLKQRVLDFALAYDEQHQAHDTRDDRAEHHGVAPTHRRGAREPVEKSAEGDGGEDDRGQVELGVLQLAHVFQHEHAQHQHENCEGDDGADHGAPAVRVDHRTAYDGADRGTRRHDDARHAHSRSSFLDGEHQHGNHRDKRHEHA